MLVLPAILALLGVATAAPLAGPEAEAAPEPQTTLGGSLPFGDFSVSWTSTQLQPAPPKSSSGGWLSWLRGGSNNSEKTITLVIPGPTVTDTQIIYYTPAEFCVLPTATPQPYSSITPYNEPQPPPTTASASNPTATSEAQPAPAASSQAPPASASPTLPAPVSPAPPAPPAPTPAPPDMLL